MRAFNYAWSLPVTWQRWRSHNSIRRIRKPHATCKNLMALRFIEPELLPIEVIHSGTFFVSVTLNLTRWPSYMKLTRIPPRYTGCVNMNFLRQGFRKLSSDRQTDRQTDRHGRNYIPCRFARGQKRGNCDALQLETAWRRASHYVP